MARNYSRNNALDYMRVLGLFLVIMAHCGVPRVLFELRNFDVTMLIFVSAFVFAIGYHGNWRNYFTRRIRRILMPVWTFLTMYFVSVVTTGQRLDWNEVLRSFLMIDGIGYVWIFRIMITLALINPLIYRLTERSNPYLTLILAVALMLGNHALGYFMAGVSERISSWVNLLVGYTVGYGVVSMIGMKWRQLNKEEKFIYFLTFAAIFVGFGIYRSWPYITDYKYPPTEYYSCYGLLWTIALYDFLTLIKIRGNAFISWAAGNTLYIYLAHIVMVETLHLGVWYYQYPCVLIGSLVIAYLFTLVRGAVRR